MQILDGFIVEQHKEKLDIFDGYLIDLAPSKEEGATVVVPCGHMKPNYFIMTEKFMGLKAIQEGLPRCDPSLYMEGAVSFPRVYPVALPIKGNMFLINW